jgi:hypothetical protein
MPRILLLLLLFSCRPQADTPPPPARLLSKEEMAKALGEILVLEQQLSESQIQRATAIDSFHKYQHIVLGSLGIDSATYYQNFAYYSFHIQDFEEIVVLAGNNLAAERDSLPPPAPQ